MDRAWTLGRLRLHRAAGDVSNWTLVATTIVGLWVITSLPYVFAYWTAPADRQFMGIVLDVPDHAQYFSWMRELAVAPLAANKLTPEANPPLFFNLLWWGLGRLGRLLQLDYAQVYQILRLAVCVAFPLAVFRLCGWLADDALKRRAAFLVILLTSGFGWVLVGLKYTLARGELWYPLDVFIAEGNTFLGLLGYPHFIGAALYILVFDLVLRGEARGQLRYAVAAGLLAQFLGWQHAYDLLSIYGVLAAYAGLQWLRDRRWPRYLIKSGLVVALLSWWPAGYSVYLTSADPLWRAVLDQFANAGVFTPGPLHLPILLGPAFLLALFAAVKANLLRLAGIPNKRLFVQGWFWVTFVLIYLPVEYQIHLLNGWQVPIGLLAVSAAVDQVAPRMAALIGRISHWGPPTPQALRWGAVIGLLAVSVPTNLYLFAWRFVDLGRHTYPYYLHTDEVAALRWLDAHAAPDDVILSSLNIGQYVPMLTGSHAFLAHWAQTVNYYDKEAMAAQFFDEATTEERRQAILRAFGVRYVFVGPAEKALGSYDPSHAPYLREVFNAPNVTVYEAAEFAD